MVNVNTTNVMVNVGSKDSTILPPKPNFMVWTGDYEFGPWDWMTLRDALSKAKDCSDVYVIYFTLPTGEECLLYRQEPNWLMRLFGYKTQWVYR